MTSTNRLDPSPSNWLLRSRYAGDKTLVTRTQKRLFSVRYEKDSLVVATQAGPRPIDPTDFAKDWAMLAAKTSIPVSKLSRSGSYVQAIYDDLHQPVDKRDRDRTFSVYAIELDEAAWADDDMRSRNPQPDLSKPCIYVGYTGESVWTRFQKHLTGRRYSKRVRKFGLRPLPELYRAANPLPDKDAALKAEEALADALRAAGFRVWEGQLGDLQLD